MTDVSDKRFAEERSSVEPPPVSEPSATRTFPWKFFWVSFALLSALMSTWSLASPLMSIPDEPAHAIRAAAVVRGEFIGDPAKEFGGGPAVTVPAYIAYTRAMGCFAFKPLTSASCQHAYTGDNDKPELSASSATPNSPVYYAVVGLPTLVFSGEFALYAMRILSSLLAASLLAFAFAMLRARGGRWSIIALVVATTPMLLFLGGSINPNATEVTAAAALFVSLIAMVERRVKGRQTWLYVIVSIASAAMLTGGRSLALLWLLLIGLAALAFANKSTWRPLFSKLTTWIVLAGIAIVAFGELAWFLIPQPSADADSASQIGSLAAVFQAMIDRTFDYWSGMVGYFGWLDQPAPGFTYTVWYTAIVGLLAGGVILGRGRARWVSLGFTAAMLVVPAIVQTSLYHDFGWVWQGRYVLAILACGLIAAGVALDAAFTRPATRPTVRAIRVTIILLAVAHLYTFVVVLRRYVVASSSWIAMIKAPKWQPPLTWIGITVVFAIILTIAVVVLWRASRTLFSAAGSDVEASPEPARV
jgi:hypothetical protein